MMITDQWFSGPVPNRLHPVGWIIDPTTRTVTVPASGLPHREPVVLRVGDDISSWGHIERHRPGLDRALEIANRDREPYSHLRADVLIAVNRLTRRYAITADELFLVADDMSQSMNAVVNDEMERGTPLELQAWIEMEIEGRVRELVELRGSIPPEGQPSLLEAWGS